MRGHGGIVLEHLKWLALHLAVKENGRFTWYTTTGWMMWNFLVGGLLTGTTAPASSTGGPTSRSPGVERGWGQTSSTVSSFPEILDSLVVDTGCLDTDDRLLVFVQLTGSANKGEELIGKISGALHGQLSSRHVSDEIRVVPGVPRTLSGRKLEIPVRRILLGTPVSEAADPSALANPEVLGSYAPGSSLLPQERVDRRAAGARLRLLTVIAYPP